MIITTINYKTATNPFASFTTNRGKSETENTLAYIMEGVKYEILSVECS